MNLTTWIEVDLDALAHNFYQLRAHTEAQVCPVVKGDAYGHGAPVVVRHLAAGGARLFAVADLDEALAVRSLSQAPLLLLAPPLPQQAAQVVRHRFIPTVTSWEGAQALAASAAAHRVKLPVHLKVDTGMGRLGVLPHQAVGLAKRIAQEGHLELAGVYTHFADGSDRRNTERQLRELLQVREALRREGVTAVLWHAAASRAFCLSRNTHLDMVRIGTLLYGQGGSSCGLPLKDTWKLYTTVIAVKSVPAGHSIGYGGDYRAPRPMVIGIIPVGYAHGFQVEPETVPCLQLKRSLRTALQGRVPSAFLGELPLPVVGRVGMTLTCLDLSSVEHPKPGMVVRLEARRTTVSPHVPKAYIKDGRISAIWRDGRLVVPEFDRPRRSPL